MPRLGSFLGGLIVGGVAVYVGLKYHVIRATDGFHLVPKLQAQFDDAYVDIRKFGVEDWNKHRSLAVAMTQSEKGYLMHETASDSLRQSVDSVLQGLGKYTGTSAPSTPTPTPAKNPFGQLPKWGS